MIFQLALIYFPALVFGFLFVKNYRKEPRQFRNALYFLLLCLFALYGLSIQFELPWLVLIGLAAIRSARWRWWCSCWRTRSWW